MLQAPGSADNVQGTSGSLDGGNPTAPPLGEVVRIPGITGTAGNVGTAGTLPDQPEPEEAFQVPAQESASQPTFHLELVRQQRKLEQVSPDIFDESFCSRKMSTIAHLLGCH
jgi:hypothetical protein